MRGLPTSSLQHRLLLLLLVGLIPAAVLSIAGLVLLASEQQSAIQRSSLETVRALLSAVDNELDRSIAAAQTLAASRRLDRGDLQGFQEDAQRVLLERPGWATIIVHEISGRQLLNLLRPPGEPLPSTVLDSESFDRVVRMRTPAVGNMIVGRTDSASLFMVRVPVIRNDKLLYILTVSVKPDEMLRVLSKQRVREDAVVAIVDAQGTIVARSRNHDKFVGQSATPFFRELIRRGREGWDISATLDGQYVYKVYARSEFSDWAVGFGRPRTIMEAPVWQSYGFIGAGLFLSIALGGFLSALIARGIAAPIHDLRAAAQALGRGEQPVLSATTLIEVNEVADALRAAAETRRQAEQAREELLRLEREARDVAEQANRAKDQFLAMLGHELRNPLAAISNAVQVLQRSEGQGELAREARDMAARQVRHLARLMDDLLDVGRLMTGKIVLRKSTINAAAAVRQCVMTLTAAGQLSRHRLGVDLDEDVWIEADPSRMEQTINNLLMNAVKYTPEGGHMRVRVAREGHECVLIVEDDGMGMAPELLPRVFDLFVQAEQALDRTQGGLGIGLTLVRHLVNLHGGTVTAWSDGPGRGSRFTVRLPAVAAPGPAPAAAVVQAPSIESRDVLIIEDNEDARTTLRYLLTLHGHTVRDAPDGNTGLAMVDERCPDVALIDLGLPGIDGYEVARRILSSCGDRRPRLVALTGYGQAEDRRRVREAGFDVHLVKPIEPELLAQLLSETPSVNEQRQAAAK